VHIVHRAGVSLQVEKEPCVRWVGWRTHHISTSRNENTREGEEEPVSVLSGLGIPHLHRVVGAGRHDALTLQLQCVDPSCTRTQPTEAHKHPHPRNTTPRKAGEKRTFVLRQRAERLMRPDIPQAEIPVVGPRRNHGVIEPHSGDDVLRFKTGDK
jgi:hypothetical protein